MTSIMHTMASHRMSLRRIGLAVVLVGLGMTLSACGYNTIPTLEEQAKARWADVQNQYQRRADLIPNLVATVQGYAAQEKSVLTAVVEARAKATQVKVDASQLTDPDKLKAFQDAQNQLSGALGRLLAVTENYPGPQIKRELPRVAVAARRYREPHRCGAARLHRGRPRLQSVAPHFPDAALGQDDLRRKQADGRIRRERGLGKAAAGEILAVVAVKTGRVMAGLGAAVLHRLGGARPGFSAFDRSRRRSGGSHDD